jgi:chorismate-pyruvate lyase
MSVIPDPAPVFSEQDMAPLTFFYGLANERPRIQSLHPAELPEIERSLLVHDQDMTPRLRQHHGCPIRLQVSAKGRISDYLLRASVLHRVTDDAPVEFGAIGIHLQHLPAAARELVLAGEVPFGAILEQHHIPHSSHPRCYFRIQVDPRLAELLHTQPGQQLYGRCNQLRCLGGEPLADVVEVLPKSGASIDG